LGLALPHTASAQQLFSVCASHGGKAWDHSALVRALEIMSNFEIGQTPAAAESRVSVARLRHRSTNARCGIRVTRPASGR
ncbi:hypothetical protein QM306_40985, partial [Burkholderia cenocepacia]|nr:hypothetical protein [Burkholderia cenocepacia]